MTLTEIERLTAAYASRRAALREAAAVVQSAIDAARRSGRPRLLRRAAACPGGARRTRSAAQRAGAVPPAAHSSTGGVRVGWRRAPARVEIADEAQTIAGIRKRFGSDAGQYLREKVTVAKAAVRGLPGRVQAALGVTVTEPVDAPCITPADSDLDQLVETLLAAPPAPGP